MSPIIAREWALYNEIDEYAAEWIENLIRLGAIAPGIVDRRSIVDICPDELRGFRQVHFFAGIGVWSYSLRRAGVSDDTALWTGSCPCQPFSAAGKGTGVDDERHLWPAFNHHIQACRPPRIYGEQVASKDGLGWLDLVFADLEASDYTVWAVDTPSAGSGAPHIRQRLRFCADDTRSAAGRLQHTSGDGWQQRWSEPSGRGIVSRCVADGLGDSESARRADGEKVARSSISVFGETSEVLRVGYRGASDGVGDSTGERSLSGALRRIHCGEEGAGPRDGQPERSGDALRVDHSSSTRLEGLGSGHHPEVGQRQGSLRPVATASGIERMADAHGRDTSAERQQRGGEQRQQPQDGGSSERMASGDDDDGRSDISLGGPQGRTVDGGSGATLRMVGRGAPNRPGPTNGFWRDADWLFCRDAKWRPIEPGTFPLVDGAAFRVGSGSAFEGKSRQGMLKGYGNAIDAEATVDFIEATLEPDTIGAHALRDSTETVPCQSPLRLDKVRQRDLEDLA